MPLTRIKKRADYLRVAEAKTVTKTQTVIVQCRYLAKNTDQPLEIRAGFTASKRVGNAVCRNRAKRRLKAWVDQHLEKKVPDSFEGNIDFVFIALKSTVGADFSKLSADLDFGIERCLRLVVSTKSKFTTC
ncbi:MAG: ribonuclease P protein component [Alphaproteobacteria bacterium]|jgi:ribonuclease P protein component|nr:ribonuclease P protein component [Alphaproteobacteria bacterium]